MIFQDNVLKEYLKNVYFITGTPCGGKTTVSKALAQKHGFVLYDVDEHFPVHQKIAERTFQPSMTKMFHSADDFFGRSVEEYTKWLLGNTREQLDFVLLDLIRLSQNQIVLCDGHFNIEEADRLTDRSRIVFLIKDPANLVEDYCNRPDHQDFREFLYSSTDVEQAKQTCNATLRNLNMEKYRSIKKSSYFWLERTADSTVEKTVCQVERHFQWPTC